MSKAKPALQQFTRIDFSQFKSGNISPQDAFELLSYNLFCRKFKISEGIKRYKNQSGLETDPITVGRKVIGWQAKFFEHAIDYGKFKESLEIAKIKYPKLKHIILYTNLDPTETKVKTKSIKPKKGKPSARENFEATLKKRGLTVEWVAKSHFQILLNAPANLDLARFYFGTGDALGFLDSLGNPQVHTFLQSKEFLLLPLTKNDRKLAKNPTTSLWNDSNKSFLIVGHPGSGKTYSMQYFLREFAGLSKKSASARTKFLASQGAIPILINLKECYAETLENLLRNRQKDFDLSKQNFIYLFDGLDELAESQADTTLIYIQYLSRQDNTKKIIISCRSGNVNRIRAKDFITEIQECLFTDLDFSFIKSYFNAKGSQPKKVLLDNLEKSNPEFLSEIKDILLISLLWETIDRLKPSSTVADLIEEKVKLLLSAHVHKKNINDLNLPDFKSEALIELNQEISFRFQEKFQYRFGRKELQEIILQKFERLDYKSTNEILNYLAQLFFENSSHASNNGSDSKDAGHIYQHRRYQEFFFTQKLKREFENDPLILRKLNVLSNREYFEGFFLPYLRKEYENQENITGILDANLLNVYLGNDPGFGVGTEYYLNSKEFVPALASQSLYRIEELLDSESFKLHKAIYIDLQKLSVKLGEWKQDNKNWAAKDYLKSIWNDAMYSALVNAETFWRANKKEIALKILENFNDALKLFEQQGYNTDTEISQQREDPWWKGLESHFYIKVYIRQQPLKDVFEFVRERSRNADSDRGYFPKEESSKEKILRCFLVALLEVEPAQLIEIAKDFDDHELTRFLHLLSRPEHLHVLLTNTELQNIIKPRLTVINAGEPKYWISFFKKLLNVAFTQEEKDYLNGVIKECLDTENNSRIYRGVPDRFAIASYGLGINTFTEINEPSDFRYYNELKVYAALLYGYIEIGLGQKSFKAILRQFIDYSNKNYESYNLVMGWHISVLWAQIVSAAKLTTDEFSTFKGVLNEGIFRLKPYAFYNNLKKIDSQLFDTIVNESDISLLQEQSSETEYQERVNEYFSFALLYSNLSELASRELFIAGLKEGMVRHGWRKDNLISHYLISCLAIMWEHNWGTQKELRDKTLEVYDLTLRVLAITDGKGTSRSRWRVVKTISDYDIQLAEELKQRTLEVQPGVRNMLVGTILCSKIKHGERIGNIESQMQEFQPEYDYERKIQQEFYEEKLNVYITLAESDYYSEKERVYAFDKAYTLAEEMKQKVSCYPTRDELYLEKKYTALCRKFGKTVNLEFRQDDSPVSLKRDTQPSQDQIQKDIERLNSKKKVAEYYSKIMNYDRNIKITEANTWKLLLEKTYQTHKNISPFIKMLEERNFPSSDWFDSNSDYFHMGLGLALKDIRMKSEAMNHIFRRTGHGGFYNMMKVYEFMGDKGMCKKIFHRFLQMCHFLCR